VIQLRKLRNQRSLVVVRPLVQAVFSLRMNDDVATVGKEHFCSQVEARHESALYNLTHHIHMRAKSPVLRSLSKLPVGH
jgi:hypothetical protein